MAEPLVTPELLEELSSHPMTVGVLDEEVIVELVRLAKSAHQSETKLERLRWGVAANAGRLSSERKPRWSHVADAAGVGSTSARRLCVDAGFDPDEQVGGGDEEDEEASEAHCESCSAAATGRTLDDVPLCDLCGEALDAELRTELDALAAAYDDAEIDSDEEVAADLALAAACEARGLDPDEYYMSWTTRQREAASHG